MRISSHSCQCKPSKRWRHSAFVGSFIFLLTLFLLPAEALAQTNCSGTLSGTYDDVIADGGSCMLDGATVRGSVFVRGGATLLATGGTEVQGSVQAESAGDLDLDDVTVLGDVSLKESQDVTVGSAGTINSLKLEKSGKITAGGAIGSIEAKESGRITLDGATIFPGSISMELADGPLKICGSTVDGTVNVVETGGNVIVDAACGASVIDGSVSVEKGQGNVRLIGAELSAGDLIIVEQDGNITVTGTTLSDVKVEKTTGNVNLTDVVTDSDTSISENGGNVTIRSSTLGSDVEIKLNGRVTLKQNNFSLEDVKVSNNSGPVNIDRNEDFTISLVENDDVTFKRNTFTDADISKNSGGVSIVKNTGESLSCSDNSPAPNGSGNTIAFTDGQCAFLSPSTSGAGPEDVPADLDEGDGSVADLGLDVPTSFSLLQNYPNPFNPVTTIVFELPTSMTVRLAVYDLLGRSVELTSGTYPAGRHEITWQADNYPSGVYLYRLDAGDFSQTRKMILGK